MTPVIRQMAAALALAALAGCSSPVERIISVQMDPLRPDGSAWDILGGPPDPFIVVDGQSYRDHACEDSYKCSFRVKGRQLYRIEVKDRDNMMDQSAGKTWCLAGKSCRTKAATVRVSG